MCKFELSRQKLKVSIILYLPYMHQVEYLFPELHYKSQTLHSKTIMRLKMLIKEYAKMSPKYVTLLTVACHLCTRYKTTIFTHDCHL